MNTCDTCKWWDRDNPEDGDFEPRGFCHCKHGMIDCEKKASDAVTFISVHKFDGIEYIDSDGYRKAREIAGARHGEIEWAGKRWSGQPSALWASAHDYYPATIVTGPKFGCIHHEPT